MINLGKDMGQLSTERGAGAWYPGVFTYNAVDVSFLWEEMPDSVLNA